MPQLLKAPTPLKKPALPSEPPNRPLGVDAFSDFIDVLLGTIGLRDAIGDPKASKAVAAGNLIAAGLPFVGAAVAGAKQAPRTLEEMAEAVTALKAYHGSPHDFEKFSTAKIGTGEGAQVYGHGLYFAEKEATAQSYRHELTRKHTRLEDATGVGSSVDAVQSKVYQAAYGSGSVSRTRAQEIAQTVADGLAQGDSVADFQRFVRASDWDAAEKQAYGAALAEAGKYRAVKPKGAMYEVSIKAKPEEFLDWDKPLSEQSAHVQAQLEQLEIPMRDRWKESGAWPHVKGKQLYEQVAEGLADYGGMMPQWARNAKAAPLATERLAQAGIQGIKYLDGVSRSAGEGSRNYVVFDDSIVDILRKYGILAPLAGAGLAAQQRQPSNGAGY